MGSNSDPNWVSWVGNNKSVLQKYLHIEFFSRNCSAIFSRNIIMKNNHPNKVLSSWRNLSLLLHTKQQSMYSNLVTLVNRLKLNLHVYTRTKNKFWQKNQFHNLLKSLGLFVFSLNIISDIVQNIQHHQTCCTMYHNDWIWCQN